MNQKVASENDPLLKAHSKYLSHAVPGTGFTYPSIRTFYRPHPQAEKLPSEPRALPLLVFIHGLGGSVAQFAPLLASLANAGPCLSIDFPGCGLSKFEPRCWAAYTTDSLSRLVATAIDKHRDSRKKQGIVLIGHSLGASIAASLASPVSPYPHLVSNNVLGLIAICPKATPPSARTCTFAKILLSIPDPLFDLWRSWNRRGGTESTSVMSFVGPEADFETKQLQLHFNEQSRTPVFRRMLKGALPDYSSGHPKGGLPGRDTWASLEIPVYLIAGAADTIAPVAELDHIASFLGKSIEKLRHTTDKMPVAATCTGLDSVIDRTQLPTTRRDGEQNMMQDVISSTPQEVFTYARPMRRSLQCNILPAPASHALLYAPATCRVLAGLIEDFLAERIDQRLSLSWQLQRLATEGKWDVKNLQKWQSVKPVSECIGNIFRAMKTMREIDDVHSPTLFVQNWKGKIQAVIDISSCEPVYAPDGLQKGGIQYYKLATISKQPPTRQETKDFIALVDKILASSADGDLKQEYIGVHCHYGFNRTGFFIVSYLVERKGYRVQDAIEEFRRQRPPGIRHEHFVDTLHVHYAVGMAKAPIA